MAPWLRPHRFFPRSDPSTRPSRIVAYLGRSDDEPTAAVPLALGVNEMFFSGQNRILLWRFRAVLTTIEWNHHGASKGKVLVGNFCF